MDNKIAPRASSTPPLQTAAGITYEQQGSFQIAKTVQTCLAKRVPNGIPLPNEPTALPHRGWHSRRSLYGRWTALVVTSSSALLNWSGSHFLPGVRCRDVAHMPDMQQEEYERFAQSYRRLLGNGPGVRALHPDRSAAGRDSI
jgi:hypothetical protein